MSRTNSVPDTFDQMLAAWFESDAHVPEPEALLDSVTARTSRSRPLPAWRLPERWLPMDLALRLPQPSQRLAPILLVIVLALALVAGALLIGSQNTRKLPAPFGPAANGQISYVAGQKLYRANADGSNPVALGPANAFSASAMYSLDGTRVAWRRLNGVAGNPSSVDMLVANADGTNVIELDTGATAMTNPSWSSDGKWLTYVRYVGDPFATKEASHLVVTASDGSGSTDLGDLGLGVWGPAFSPDGSMIAVSAAEGALWVVNRDGTGLRKLTHGAYPEVGFKGISSAWSPDGKTLLFSAGLLDVEGRTIYAVGLDGAPERPFSPSRASQDDAVYSPDGQHVAFLQQSIEGRGPVLLIADTTGRIVNNPPGIYSWFTPEWSPDGTKVAVFDGAPDRPDAPAGKAAIVIIDALGTSTPAYIYVDNRSDGSHADNTLAWQRLALP